MGAIAGYKDCHGLLNVSNVVTNVSRGICIGNICSHKDYLFSNVTGCSQTESTFSEWFYSKWQTIIW